MCDRPKKLNVELHVGTAAVPLVSGIVYDSREACGLSRSVKTKRAPESVKMEPPLACPQEHKETHSNAMDGIGRRRSRTSWQRQRSRKMTRGVHLLGSAAESWRRDRKIGGHVNIERCTATFAGLCNAVQHSWKSD